MLLAGLKDICKKEYKGYTIYFHNFSRFDGIFIFNILSKIGRVNPIFRDSNLISMRLRYRKLKFLFYDSYLITLASLAKLAKAFKLNQGKTIFPYSFVNLPNINLNYIGGVPDAHHFNVSFLEYLEYARQFETKLWSLKEETIKYCLNDCVILHNILMDFSSHIFNLFSINIHKYPTLPSLAFAIFRSNFLPLLGENIEITQISGKVHNEIRVGYTGGCVDVYKPLLIIGFSYDYNSLYPSVMLKFNMPVGNPTHFIGDIRKYQPDAFGFFRCKITVPEDLKYPILQTHVKTKDGIRTVAAVGKYEDMLFSEEMDNAKKFGYKFDILLYLPRGQGPGARGEKAIIFAEFIGVLYKTSIS